MTVGMILRQKGSAVTTVPPTKTALEAVTLLSEHRIGAVLVTDHAGRVIGVFSERDVVIAVARGGVAALDQTVGEIMTSPVFSCGPNDSIDDVMSWMTERRIRHLPVMHDGELIGIVSIGDVVKSRISEMAQETDQMRAYIAAG